jgi:hypothetical protein
MDRETVRLIVYQMVKALDHMHSLNVRLQLLIFLGGSPRHQA